MRKLIILLSVIFYAASLLVLMASLNQVAAKEIHGKPFGTRLYPPGLQNEEDAHPSGGGEVPGRLIEMDSASR